MGSPLRQQKPENIFESIRTGFKTVTRMASHVRVREDLIPAYADSLVPLDPEKILDPRHHYLGDAESTAAYILTLDSVNFGSGYEPAMVQEGWQLVDGSLYFTLATRLKQYFDVHGPLPAARLTALETKDCTALLGLNEKGPYSYEFAQLCTDALRELGQVVAERYDGEFLAMVRAARGSAEAMVRLLAQLGHFNDVHHYHGHEIPFYKRAQITAADLHIAFRRLGEELFGDIDQLTMFADNGVPHVFHIDGLLEYEPALEARIAKGHDIPSGSPEEIEIRACAGHIVEQIAARKGMIAMDIDHILWHKSVEDRRYRDKEPHRTLSGFY